MNRKLLLVLTSLVLFSLVACFLSVCGTKNIADGPTQSTQRTDKSPSRTALDDSTGDQDQIPQPVGLARHLKNLKSNDTKAIDTAHRALVEAQTAAIPVLKSGLADRETRLACVRILAQIPAEQTASILVEELEKTPETKSRDRYYKMWVVGALGRLKAQGAIQALEALLQARKAKGGPTSEIAWALKEITGKDYGATWDPWSGCGE